MLTYRSYAVYVKLGQVGGVLGIKKGNQRFPIEKWNIRSMSCFHLFPLSRRLEKYVKSILSKFSQYILYLGESCTSYLHNGVVLVRESTDHSFFGFERMHNGTIVRLKINSFNSIMLIFYRI